MVNISPARDRDSYWQHCRVVVLTILLWAQMFSNFGIALIVVIAYVDVWEHQIVTATLREFL
jgi:hypothetical protein